MDENAQALAVDANGGDNMSGAQAQERMIPQSEVNKLIQGAKQNAAMRARQEFEAEQAQRAQQQSLQSMSPPQGQNASKQDGADAMYQQFMERFNQELQQRQVEQELEVMKSNYANRLEQGRSSYGDFNDVMKDFEPADFPQLTYLVSGLDNGGHILYELAKTPSKLVYLNTLAKESPRMARSELAKLSQSIAANQQAMAESQGSEGIAAPLDQLQPSRVSGSNGKMSIRDLQAQPWLKG